MEKRKIKALKNELKEMQNLLMLEMPFIASLLRKCKIVIDEKIETAGVTKKELIINPDFFESLSKKQKMFVYCHEALHLAFRHLLRMENKDRELFVVSTDCPINHILMTHGFENLKFPFDLITPESLSRILFKKEREIAKMSVEEIYYLLKKSKRTPEFNLMEDLIDAGKIAFEKSTVIQNGDPLSQEARTPEEVEKYWKEALSQAVIQGKMAGNLPGNFKRLVDKLFEAKVTWKEIIKKEIINSLGKITISDWRRVSRRYPFLPGNKSLTRPNIWFLIDTSGSISDNELKQFLSEVYSIIKTRAAGIIMPWDAKVYPSIELKKPRDIELPLKNLTGGGGTNILPALEEVFKRMKLGDLVIVLTDGHIFDLNNPKTKISFEQVGQKSSAAIFATIKKEIDLPPKWKRIKIEL